MNLAERQAELVRALVATGPDPRGFDPDRLAATRKALLRKRAEEVRRMWPRLASSYQDNWLSVFSRWAAHRQPQGALRDGWEFARAHPPQGPAAIEFLVHDARMRRLPAIRIGHGVVVIQVAGRVFVLP